MIIVELDYYNANEKAKLSAFPYDSAETPWRVLAYQANSLIKHADFLSYYLIHRSRSDGHRTFHDRLSLAASIVEYMKPIISLGNNKTIQVVVNGPVAGDFAERIGEAVGLAVISKMHILIEADWTVLQTFPGKNGFPTFDFEIASDSRQILQLEAKGTIVADNHATSIPTVHQHAAKVRAKKKKLDTLGPDHAPDPYPALIRYGTITAIDSWHNAKCLLLDPPAIDVDIEPIKLRLLKRLSFVACMLRMMSPNATLPVVIEARVVQILESKKPLSEWDRVPLPYNGGIGFFKVENYVETFLSRGKIYLSTHGIIGKIYQLERDQRLFFGFCVEPIQLVIQQNFSGLLDMHFGKDFDDLSVDLYSDMRGSSSGDGARFHLITSSSGVVFGFDHQETDR